MGKLKIEFENLEMEGDKYVIHLESAIQAHGETTNTLLLNEPRLKHLKKLDACKGDIQKTIAMVSELAAIPMGSAEEISIRDLRLNIEPVLEALMGESPETGETS
jgi:hypothetical protein